MNKLMELYNKIPADKQGHISLGLLLGLAFGAHLLLAVIAVIGVAVGKELADYLHNVIAKAHVHDVEVLDAVATIAGGAIGIGVVTVINLIVGRIL